MKDHSIPCLCYRFRLWSFKVIGFVGLIGLVGLIGFIGCRVTKVLEFFVLQAWLAVDCDA